jgi:hypothetical protein
VLHLVGADRHRRSPVVVAGAEGWAEDGAPGVAAVAATAGGDAQVTRSAGPQLPSASSIAVTPGLAAAATGTVSSARRLDADAASMRWVRL